MNIESYLSGVVSRFKKAGLGTPLLDAQVILAHVMGVERHRLIIDNKTVLPEKTVKTAESLVSRRLQREPIAYLKGKKEFYSLDFIVNPDVLIPRPETEIMVELILSHISSGNSILDVGTGSGVIAVCAAYYRTDLNVYASDVSFKALKVAQLNEKRLLSGNRVKFFCGDLFSPLKDAKFNVIVSNPPYVGPGLKGKLQRELEFEPHMALYSQDEGTAIIKRIICEASGHLHGGGKLILEISPEQKNLVQSLGEMNGFKVYFYDDHAGNVRVSLLWLKN